MATNDFLPFADANGANVLDQADYVALAQRPTGFSSGKANSEWCNKVWRQASSAAYLLGQIVCDVLGVNAADDGDTATLLANVKQALASNGNVVNVKTAAGPYNAAAGDRVLVINQLVGAPFQVNLPNPPPANYCLEVIDGKGDADVNNITINGNGNTINGRNTFILNQKYQPLRLIWNGTQFNIGA